MTGKEKQYELMRYRMMSARAQGVLEAGNPELAAEMSACAELFRLELIDRFATIEDERVRTVMSLRYLHGMEWQKIADHMYFGLRWVMRLHKRGLELL